ncbi:MAG: aminotransferase class III-fold pyridoxal phosphate-dependent enzyme [Caldilineaceae bacterium]|nr:aminotransferase class III-fold pyridoxal phosphate-dependent enzyme [Caldilineaceae bacterium]
MTTFEKSKQLIAEASRYLPGGVNSNFRVGMRPTPLVFERGEGPYLYDVDGNRLIDYYLGMGPMILGHSPAPVLAAVQEQLRSGILFAGQTEVEREAAKMVCEMVPCAERVRFSCAGSEVVQAAWRLARAATGRSIIVKFEGHYHGWLDSVLWSVAPPPDRYGPADAPNRVPASVGQDAPAGEHTDVLPWNNLALLRTRLERGDVAAVIMEPAMCNTSAILPNPGYLEGVRQVCTDTGTLLIFDEVITGFRVAPGGAQQLFGVTPDLATFGKAIASGFPVSCLAGKADLMEMFASGGVMHGGTFNSQPASMAAVVATLSQLRQPETFAKLETQGTRLMQGIQQALADADIQARVEGFPQVFHVAFGVEKPVTDYRSSLQADKARYINFTEALHHHGVRALERGAWFMSTEHSADVVDVTLEAVAAVARQV